MTSPSLRVAALQMEQQHMDIEANVAHLWELIEGATFDLLVLPEMWTTGFVTKVEELPEAYFCKAYEAGRTAMHQVAKQYNAAIYGSLIELQPSGKPANTGLFITPDGTETRYLKRHLFGYGGESKLFEAGEERVQVTYRGWNIRLSTCYDLRFPVWLRQDPSLGDYDLLLLSANWPRPRHIAWERLLRARAIENQCYLVATNRVGTPHPKLQYPGYSFILDDLGDSLAESKEAVETLLSYNLSLEELTKSRSRFPLLPDADLFTLY